MCVFSSMQFYHMCSCMWHSLESRYRTVPSQRISSPPFIATTTSFLPHHPTQSLATINLFSISIIFVTSRMLHKWNHIVCKLLRLSFFHSAQFPRNPSSLLAISLTILLCSQVVFHGMDVTLSSLNIHSLKNNWGDYVWEILSSWTSTYFFFHWTYIFIALGWTYRMKLVGWMVSKYLVL